MSHLKPAHRCGIRCATDPPPKSGILPEVVVDLVKDKVPLWSRSTSLNWRFDEGSFERFGDAERVKRKVSQLMRDAMNAWGNVAPVKFNKSNNLPDFEIYMRQRRDCKEGCVLASAFFPSSKLERVTLYPSMFEYDQDEQLSTMVHEIGHIFGLRHFFADTDAYEKKFPSLVFGKHSRYTIMNYGSESRLTRADREDLGRLYEAAWSAGPEAEIGKEVILVEARHAKA